MNYKFQYADETDRQQIMTNNSNKELVEEHVLFDGNYLVFTDIKPIEYQLKEQQENQLVLMEVLATMYEDMLAKGTV